MFNTTEQIINSTIESSLGAKVTSSQTNNDTKKSEAPKRFRLVDQDKPKLTFATDSSGLKNKKSMTSRYSMLSPLN